MGYRVGNLFICSSPWWRQRGRGGQRDRLMSEKKTLFRKILETIAEGRNRQAQRYVNAYLKTHGLDRPSKD
jgi:hypothetical protein